MVYFPWIATLRDPGYNIAYWNIGQRPLTRAADSRLLANGRPLVIFHYSFFTPAMPDFLVNRPPLVFPVEGEVLRDYAAPLTIAGSALCLSWPYLYAAFANRKPVKTSHRQYYLDRVWQDPDHRGSPFDPAFTSRNCRGLKSVYFSDHPSPSLIRSVRLLLRQGEGASRNSHPLGAITAAFARQDNSPNTTKT